MRELILTCGDTVVLTHVGTCVACAAHQVGAVCVSRCPAPCTSATLTCVLLSARFTSSFVDYLAADAPRDGNNIRQCHRFCTIAKTASLTCGRPPLGRRGAL